MDGFWSWPLFVLVPLVLVAMLIAHELGRRLHLAHTARSGDGADTGNDQSFILSGVLGLLALLLGFSFSMALTRLEDRRELMFQEASAIGYIALLAEGLPQADAEALKADLARYATARVAAAELPDGAARVRAAERASALRKPVADKVRVLLRKGEAGPYAVALANAYDKIEDTAVRRQALTQAHLPERVLWLLATYAAISASMLGYALAGSVARHRVASTTLYLLISLAFGVILDLDRPRSGAIVVDQAPLEETVRELNAGMTGGGGVAGLTPAPPSPAIRR